MGGGGESEKDDGGWTGRRVKLSLLLFLKQKCIQFIPEYCRASVSGVSARLLSLSRGQSRNSTTATKISMRVGKNNT